MWNTFGGKKAQKFSFALNPPFCQCDVSCSIFISKMNERKDMSFCFLNLSKDNIHYMFFLQ